MAQPPPGAAHPENPHQVIHQPQTDAQRHRSGQRDRLGMDVNAHSAQKPGEEAAPDGLLLIGQGVHSALHL